MNPAKSKNGNGNGNLSRLFDMIEGLNAKNDLAHTEIKIDIQKNRTEIVEKVSELRERLVRIESQPAHENFQRNFCPNTKDIQELKATGSKGLRDYIDQHKMDHEKLHEMVDKVLDSIEESRRLSELKIESLVNMYEKKIDDKERKFSRLLWATFISLLAIGVPAIIELFISL